MKISGTIHLIHKENNEWCFKYKQDKVDQRVPFVFYTGQYTDGQQLDCYLETIANVERAKPLFPLPISFDNQNLSIGGTSLGSVTTDKKETTKKD